MCLFIFWRRIVRLLNLTMNPGGEELTSRSIDASTSVSERESDQDGWVKKVRTHMKRRGRIVDIIDLTYLKEVVALRKQLTLI